MVAGNLGSAGVGASSRGARAVPAAADAVRAPAAIGILPPHAFAGCAPPARGLALLAPSWPPAARRRPLVKEAFLKVMLHQVG